MSRSQEFPRPPFLKPSIEIKKIKQPFSDGEVNESFQTGSFLRVCELRNLPTELKQMLWDGFVIKQYDLGKNDSRWRIIFADNYNFVKESTLEEKAVELKKRHRRITESFSALPNLIVPTEFIVGTDPGGEKRVYELQPKIDFVELKDKKNLQRYILEGTNNEPGIENFLYKKRTPIPNEITEQARTWASQIKKIFPDRQEKIKVELLKFISIARLIPKDTEEIPFDVVWFPNLVFTSDGIRIIDVNTFYENEPVSLARYNQMLDIWQIVADAL